MRNSTCCEKCYGRQGTTAGGGTFCFNSLCECHRVKEAWDTSKSVSEIAHDVRFPKSSPSPEANWEYELKRVLSLSPYTKNNLKEISPWISDFICSLLSSSKSKTLASIEAMIKDRMDLTDDMETNQALSQILDEVIKMRR